MKTTKRFALVAMFVLGTAAPAMAGAPLYPVGDEPNASGAAWAKLAPLAQRIDVDNYLKVSCSRLTPGETYVVTCWFVDYWTGELTEVGVGSFMADGRGKGNISWTYVGPGWVWWWADYPIRVYRLSQGNSTLVLSSTPP